MQYNADDYGEREVGTRETLSTGGIQQWKNIGDVLKGMVIEVDWENGIPTQSAQDGVPFIRLLTESNEEVAVLLGPAELTRLVRAQGPQLADMLEIEFTGTSPSKYAQPAKDFRVDIWRYKGGDREAAVEAQQVKVHTGSEIF